MKILVIHYSQTGQLTEIVDKFSAALNNFDIDYIKFDAKEAYPFPWTMESFMNVMPESVLEIPVALNALHFKHEQYDWVILAYQPWFLSPSLPVTSLFQSINFRDRVKNAKFITLVGARNMWLNAHDSIQSYINSVQGKHMGNIVFQDRHSNLPSAISIVHWMLKGKKERKWKIFPKPGISSEDIASAQNYGEIFNQHLESSDLSNLQDKFISAGGASISTPILFIEMRAKKLFKIWANIIIKKGNTDKKRKIWVHIFKYYLIFALFFLSPIVLLLFYIFLKPFSPIKIKKLKYHYSYL